MQRPGKAHGIGQTQRYFPTVAVHVAGNPPELRQFRASAVAVSHAGSFLKPKSRRLSSRYPPDVTAKHHRPAMPSAKVAAELRDPACQLPMSRRTTRSHVLCRPLAGNAAEMKGANEPLPARPLQGPPSICLRRSGNEGTCVEPSCSSLPMPIRTYDFAPAQTVASTGHQVCADPRQFVSTSLAAGCCNYGVSGQPFRVAGASMHRIPQAELDLVPLDENDGRCKFQYH